VITMRKSRQAVKDSSGAAAVEFALVLPLLMLLLLGGLDWGYYFFVAQVTTNAAREGARVGSLEPTYDGLSEADARATVRQYISGAGFDPDKTGASVTITFPGEAINVAVSYPVGSLTGFLRIVVPAAARATSEMRRY